MNNWIKGIIGKSRLLWDRHGSDILVYGGCAGIVVGVVLACIETTHVEQIVDETKEQIDDVKNSNDIPNSNESKAQIAKIWVKGAGRIALNYAPSVAVICLSEASIFGGHHIIKKKNAALTAAFAALSEAFKRYRERVEADVGPEKEREYYYGKDVVSKVASSTDETNQAKEVFNGMGISPYARYFDAENHLFCDNPSLNLMRLKAVQEEMNHRLRCYGHVFLREVYSALGYDEEDAKVASVVGWVDNGRGDNTIDFHLYDSSIPQNVAFINGKTPIALLDFNVDGNIEYIYKSWFGDDTAKKLIECRDAKTGKYRVRR